MKYSTFFQHGFLSRSWSWLLAVNKLKSTHFSISKAPQPTSFMDLKGHDSKTNINKV